MGGRGSRGETITLEQARGLVKQEKSLNQRIGRLEENIKVVQGKYPAILATQLGKRRYESAKKTYNADQKKLDALQKERDEIQKKLEKYKRRISGRNKNTPF